MALQPVQLRHKNRPGLLVETPALVEELSAIHTAWLASFDSTDAGYGPIGWHERFAQTCSRLKSHYKGECSRGHTDRPTRIWPADTTDQEWRTWIRTPSVFAIVPS